MNDTLSKSCFSLDLGGVLFYDEYIELFFHYSIFRLLHQYNVVVTEDLFFKQREQYYPSLKNEWVNTWLKQITNEKIAGKINKEAWNQTLKKFSNLFKPYPETYDFLDKLHRKFRLFCLANQPAQVGNILCQLGLSRYFEAIILDGQTGYSKPDIRFFKAALEKIKEHPNKIIHCGDRFDNDVKPALDCGMQAVKLTLPLEPVSLPSIPVIFTQSFYQSLKIAWHRWEESSSFQYLSFTNQEDLLKVFL